MPSGQYDRSKAKPKSRRPWEERFWEKVSKSDGCWNWVAGVDQCGYGRFMLVVGETMKSVHRISYEIHFGKIPDEQCVCHRCDNPKCVNPEHLFLGTHTENMRDCENKKRRPHPTGEKHPRSKVSDKDLAEIRRLFSLNFSNKYIAQRFPLHHKTIQRIRIGKGRKVG